MTGNATWKHVLYRDDEDCPYCCEKLIIYRTAARLRNGKISGKALLFCEHHREVMVTMDLNGVSHNDTIMAAGMEKV